jgi:hypothetical protein
MRIPYFDYTMSAQLRLLPVQFFRKAEEGDNHNEALPGRQNK